MKSLGKKKPSKNTFVLNEDLDALATPVTD